MPQLKMLVFPTNRGATTFSGHWCKKAAHQLIVLFEQTKARPLDIKTKFSKGFEITLLSITLSGFKMSMIQAGACPAS
jgi:hypothetical protein